MALFSISRPRWIISVTKVLSSQLDALIRTFIYAPITELRAQSAPTPASETEFGLPVSAIAFITSMLLKLVSITLNGTSIAILVASCIALFLKLFSSSVLFGNVKAAMIRLNALVSASTRPNNSLLRASAFSAQLLNSSHLSSQPFLCEERLATIPAKAIPSDPTYAAIDPPPGAGLSLAVSSAKSLNDISTSRVSVLLFKRYSIILSSGLKGASSSSPKDLIAILISSFSDTPTDRCCFFKKYLPASSNDCRGTSPTSSLPVTRIPLLSAFLHTSSNAMCTGVIRILVRFMDIWATPYSSINHPIAFTAFRLPGIETGLPDASNTVLPLSFFTLPASRTSNAMAFARRVEVVLRLML